ncbi:MAG: hypothetical protein EZS28_041896, partial [Streblomastix strix]
SGSVLIGGLGTGEVQKPGPKWSRFLAPTIIIFPKIYTIQIQNYEDEKNQTELVNVGYGSVTSIAFCTAGGVGEEQDAELFNILDHFYYFLRQLHQGITYWQRSFQPLPLLVRRTEEQIEEEGANEELEAQIKNNGNWGRIKYWATGAKAETLNRFILRD